MVGCMAEASHPARVRHELDHIARRPTGREWPVGHRGTRSVNPRDQELLMRMNLLVGFDPSFARGHIGKRPNDGLDLGNAWTITRFHHNDHESLLLFHPVSLRGEGWWNPSEIVSSK